MKKQEIPIETGLFKSYPDVLSVQDLCQALHIARAGAYKLLSAGAIRSFKIGRVYKIPKDSLIAYVNQTCSRKLERSKTK